MRVRGSQMMRDNDVLNSPRILDESLSSTLDFFIGKMDVKQGLVQGLWGLVSYISLWLKWSEEKVAQSCPTLCNPMDYTVHGILQARILEWVAVPFSRGSSQPRDWTQVSHIAGRFLTNWAIVKAPENDAGRIQKKLVTVVASRERNWVNKGQGWEGDLS